ncbi:NAD(P)-binding protein [Cryphonectria parasitica EP155]|uniref:NAD(P)-binding protein n=1 Tax=Cryphonectria parasitica (strain ATCC 38755 / EP155) TaxID=660469 RepID=A0A9P4Y744_CRYP1|nr:NAD(P)-binding protein [Cryphonectria parasitica EP155]KAF3767577.1 NAD(P)-binding protein [Cryphonectria parasitica EP155]
MPPLNIAFNPAKDIPSLLGKTILITGANTGLGKASALELARHNPSHLWMAARHPTKGRAAAADVQRHAPAGTAVSFLELDLSSLASVRAAARAFLSSAARLDILLLNAGIMGCPPAVSEDGYEVQFATNHLGHALLLRLLTPLLLTTTTTTTTTADAGAAGAAATSDVRVVSLASVGYKYVTAGTIQFDTLADRDQIMDPSVVSPVQRYTQSKLANVLYAQEVARRFPQFTTVSVDPGAVATELFSREPGDAQMETLQTTVAPQRGRPVEEGVLNPLWAATTVQGVESGRFYEPVGKGGLEEGLALDRDLADRLWQWTEKALEGQEC